MLPKFLARSALALLPSFCSTALSQVNFAPLVDPVAATADLLPANDLQVFSLPFVDLAAVAQEDRERAANGEPWRYAIPHDVFITPDTDGTWEPADPKANVWRLRISSPGAYSLNFGFTQFHLPDHARLTIYATDYTETLPPFTAADNEEHNQLWTPVLLSDDVTLELYLPIGQENNFALELTAINHGYRGFGEPDPIDDPNTRAGSCNNDVVCPEGDPWRDEIPAIAAISTGGSAFCTGFLVNNTAQDRKPYFMTANHCGITSGNAASLVAYWNFESPTCGAQCCGSLSQFNTGSFFRSTYSTSDFTLVELDDALNPAHELSLAGWDKTDHNANDAIAIHHPNVDEKSISFEYDSTTTTSYLGTSVPGDGTHVRVIDWDDGTTEPGSSGSPLFDENHHVIGQLHGGYAACGNNSSDWYGRFYRSWTGGGTNATRLSNWLDAGNTGANSVDTILAVPQTGLKVTPTTGLTSTGPHHGPFSPSSIDYTVENQDAVARSYTVTPDVAWLTVTNGAGSVPALGSVLVTVSINASANALDIGQYAGTVAFTNTSNHDGDTTRPASLEVGRSVVYSNDLSTNPGWTVQGQWAWGDPTGGGGQYGGPDPTTGYTGSNVYGYNLAGDYPNNLTQQHLTSTAIDCTGVTGATLRFKRWLGVEQPAYDHAYVRVSNNGSTYTTIWQNDAEIADTTWQTVEYDISAVADNQATVYLRWTMGSTDSSWQFCGWNIDDVEILGFVESPGIPGDIDGDGDVDLDDLSIMLVNFGTTSGAGPEDGDLDGDGDVDLDDLSILLVNFGT